MAIARSPNSFPASSRACTSGGITLSPGLCLSSHSIFRHCIPRMKSVLVIPMLQISPPHLFLLFRQQVIDHFRIVAGFSLIINLNFSCSLSVICLPGSPYTGDRIQSPEIPLFFRQFFPCFLGHLVPGHHSLHRTHLFPSFCLHFIAENAHQSSGPP